ncbi:MAG: YitT family protein [Ruminococcus sp.]|nr:YitT family protein [Ruminococcus sp.]
MLKNRILDYMIITCGAALYAMSVVVFTAPNNIAPGGLTGVATLINYLFSLPIGTFILIMNVPLLIIGYRRIGRTYFIKTVYGTLAVSLLIDLFSCFIPAYKGNMILVCLFGGILNGCGIALIFSRGGSSGGTDILASLINKRFPQFSIGHLIMFSDALIVTISAFVYNSIEAGLYAVVSIFVSSKLIDRIIYGTSADNGKLMFIITDKSREILPLLLNDISRGVTVLEAHGGYSGNDKKLLVCAVRPNQVYKVNNIVKKLDSSVFIIVTTATAVNGEGFYKKY